MREPKTERLGTCRECGRGIYWERDRGTDELQRAQVVCRECARKKAVELAEAAERAWISETDKLERQKASKVHLRRQKQGTEPLREMRQRLSEVA